MSTIQSRVTAQGQISVPADIRKKLGVGPGSILEWEDKNGEVLVRRAGRHTSAEVHVALFPEGAPAAVAAADVKDAIRRHVLRKHARG
jgi:antitoxin PrlF